MPEMRLQKYIANSGVCSRRKSEELILAGKVTVNDKVVKELGTKINPDKDIVTVNKKRIELIKDYKYILINKPVRICNNSKRSVQQSYSTGFSKKNRCTVASSRKTRYVYLWCVNFD